MADGCQSPYSQVCAGPLCTGGIVKRFKDTTPGAGLYVRRLLELVATLPIERVFHRQNTHRHSWAWVARQLVLLPLCLLGWSAFSRATADESAVPLPAPIEFTVQTGHTA